MPTQKPPRFKKVFDQVSRYGTVGLELGLSVGIGVVMGYYLDKWLDTSPWLTIFMMLCGVASGFKRLYSAMKQIEKEEKQRES